MGFKVGKQIGSIPVHQLEKDDFPWWGWLIVLAIVYAVFGGK